MTKVFVAIVATALLIAGFTYFAPTEENQALNVNDQAIIKESFATGVYEFSEVSPTPDLNGETFSSWQHTLTILDGDMFEYAVDGRMALIRVRGSIERGEQSYSFITNENFMTESGAEPFPTFEPGTVIFTGVFPEVADELLVSWEAASGNLPEHATFATFVKQ